MGRSRSFCSSYFSMITFLFEKCTIGSVPVCTWNPSGQPRHFVRIGYYK